jgi:hypothetical protein
MYNIMQAFLLKNEIQELIFFNRISYITFFQRHF